MVEKKRHLGKEFKLDICEYRESNILKKKLIIIIIIIIGSKFVSL